MALDPMDYLTSAERRAIREALTTTLVLTRHGRSRAKPWFAQSPDEMAARFYRWRTEQLQRDHAAACALAIGALEFIARGDHPEGVLTRLEAIIETIRTMSHGVWVDWGGEPGDVRADMVTAYDRLRRW